MKDLVIVGSSGFAREVKWLIDECNKIDNKYNILGFVSNDIIGTVIDGLPILGSDDFIMNYDKELSVVIAIGNGSLRKKLSTLYSKKANVEFPNIIAPNAIMSHDYKIGIGNIITFGCFVSINATIGNFVLANWRCIIGHDCIVKDYASLYADSQLSGNTIVGECSTIGTGGRTFQGKKIGDNSFVGAGSVAFKDVPDNCSVLGVPAKVFFKKV